MPIHFDVTLGDERRIKGIGRYDSVELQFQWMLVTLIFFLFELGSMDIILSMDWLCKLGEVKVGWKLQIMKF